MCDLWKRPRLAYSIFLEITFKKFNEFGQTLFNEKHRNSEEIKEKIDEVQEALQNLER